MARQHSGTGLLREAARCHSSVNAPRPGGPAYDLRGTWPIAARAAAIWRNPD